MLFLRPSMPTERRKVVDQLVARHWLPTTKEAPIMNIHTKAALTVTAYVIATAALVPFASAATHPQVVAQLQEDDPGWDCNTMGNRVCGDPTNVHAGEAWAAWDKAEGWRLLPASSVEDRVDYIGTSTSDTAPIVDTLTQVAVPAREGWYVFRSTPSAPADPSCDPSSCDPDEGEDIPAEELAAINAEG
jgi:hypothetical protein